jgi:hypothetical protein
VEYVITGCCLELRPELPVKEVGALTIDPDHQLHLPSVVGVAPVDTIEARRRGAA